MRIKKTSQYMQGGASLSNVYGTSNENGYTQEYINSLTSSLDLFKITELPLTYSRNSNNMQINYTINNYSVGYILICGRLGGSNVDDVYVLTTISFNTIYAYSILKSSVTNGGTSTLINNGKTLQIPFTASNIPTNIGTVKAVLIELK